MVSSGPREGDGAGRQQTCTLSSSDQSVVTESTRKERSEIPRALTNSMNTGEVVDGSITRECENVRYIFLQTDQLWPSLSQSR